MLDCKAMASRMASNLKLLSDASFEKVDATMHCQMIGSLMYLMNMRPDICFVVNTLSQFLMDPRYVHVITAKHILRFLKSTMDYGIKYDVNQKINLHGYVDSDWEGSTTNSKRTSGCCFSLGSGMISWFSRKQSCVVSSTTEAEYVACFSPSCKIVWI